MAYAMKRRRNAGAPKRRKQLTTMRGSASFKRGQRLAGKLIAGRKLRGSQKEIRQQIHKLVRENGSKSDIALLEGPIGVGKAPHEFRKGLASVAADVAGFEPSRSSSRAGKTVSSEFDRDKRDTKRGFESASARAMRVRAEQGVSLKEAWAIVKGESKPKRKSSAKRKNPRASGIRMRENFDQLVKYAGDVGEPRRFEFFSAQPMSSRGRFGSKPFIIQADDAFDIENQVNLATLGKRVPVDHLTASSEVIIQGLSAKQAEDMVNSKKAEFFEPGSRRRYSSWPFKSARKRDSPRRNGTKKGMMRKTSRRAYEKNPFGAEFLFI